MGCSVPTSTGHHPRAAMGTEPSLALGDTSDSLRGPPSLRDKRWAWFKEPPHTVTWLERPRRVAPLLGLALGLLTT